MTKPPSRKHYEKTKPTYKELENKLINANHNLTQAQQYERDLKNTMRELRIFKDWFHVLKRSEVMVLTPEGMKYLVGQDLEDFCKAEMEKQNSNKIWWDEIGTSAFIKPANAYLNEILRDEVDKLPVHESQLDAYKYITKGIYDTGSKSKEEGS